MQYQTSQNGSYGQWGYQMQQSSSKMYYPQQQMMQMQNQGNVQKAPRSPSTPPPMAVEVDLGNNTFSSRSSTSSSPESFSNVSAVDTFDVPASQNILNLESPSRWQAFRSFLSPCTSKQAVMRSLAMHVDDSSKLQLSPSHQVSPSHQAPKHQMTLDTGACSKPHPTKVATGGEDAHIVRECNGIWLSGVLDGVGSWSSLGVDPSIYSRKFAQLISDSFVEWCLENKMSGGKPLLNILDKAFAGIQRTGLQGSCTICLSMLFPSGKLHVLNLGDSGLRVVRNGQVVFASTEQQVCFNTPRQLGGGSGDIPAYGDYNIIPVQKGDIYLVASDGAWDNLWQHEWLKIVQDFERSGRGQRMDKLATRLCEEAHKHGADVNYESPFAVSAKKAGVGFYCGGKLDDTTVVVNRVR
mmetsp:Transcript_51807/g.121636  ORF Transcript_51807/g.121636 Transcript_51807/m.121636 type:complete len:410 (+) Transcript_51807:224-1453(+)